MKPATDTGRELSGNLTGEKIKFRLDEDSTEHLMGLLTNAYSDPERACLREYATNGADSHVEAGVRRPIEIELPTDLRPVLTIRDFGVGLTRDDLDRIYTRYGASTKRESDAVNGMMGIGSKAALTYTDQFTLIAVKDGERVHASVVRTEDGVPELTIALREPTEDPNGVTIQIPTKRGNRFAAKARELFGYWPEGSVLIDGEPPERVGAAEGDLRLTDRLLITEGTDHVIVMGGVPYPAEFEKDRLGLPYGKRLVAFVEIGEVHFTPSREALLDTPTTKRTRKRLVEEFKRELGDAITRGIAAAPTAPEAVAKLSEWAELADLSGTTVQWGGEAIPAEFGVNYTRTNPARIGDYAYPLEQGEKATRRGAWVARAVSWGPKNATSWVEDGISAAHVPPYVWVEDFAPKGFTAQHRAKLDEYTKDDRLDNGAKRPYVLLRGSVPDALREWIDPDRIVSWEDTRKIRVASSGGGGNQRAVGAENYEAWSDSHGDFEHTLSTDALKRFAHVFYFGALGRQDRWGPNLRERRERRVALLRELFPGCAIVRVTQNRQEKFLRSVPMAQAAENSGYAATAVRGALEQAWWDFKKSLTDAEWEALTTDTASHWLTKVDPARIKDPDLRGELKAIRDARPDDRKVKLLAMFSAAACARGWNGRKETWKPNLAKYPLADTGYAARSNQDHAILYINAAYAADKKGTP